MKNFTFKINENSYSVKIVSQEKNTIALEVNGTSYCVEMKQDISKSKTPTLVRKPSTAKPQAPVKVNPNSSATTKVTAPIPGVVLALSAKVGDTVKAGDELLILEAMKMENHIVADKGGTIKTVSVAVNQQVLQGEVMIEIE